MIADTIQHNGYTIEIHYDTEGYAADPRDACNVGTFLGFPHRSYKIGDETFDPSDATLTCKGCDGTGTVTFPIMGEEVDRECGTCEGYGNLPVRNWADVETLLRSEYEIVGPILKVGMIDHSGVSYYIGGGAHWSDSAGWDSGTCGVIFATRAQVDETGCPEDKIVEALTSEVDEYSKWANGEVYGYVVKDVNGDEVDACWGFLGDDYVVEAAKEAVPADMPAKLYTLRLTAAQIETVDRALCDSATDNDDALNAVRAQYKPTDD